MMDTNMKPAARFPFPLLALLLCLCSTSAFASYAEQSVWEGRVAGGSSGSGAGSGRPYHFGEESFRHWTRTRQGRFSVLERFDDELLEKSVGRYRVAVLEAAPRAFMQPSHYDADEVMFVSEGEGVMVLLHGSKRKSFCVREGDVMVIPAGAVVYSANTHGSDWFRVVMLLSPVSTPGRFEEFFPVGGGERTESFFSVFSDDVIQAAFNTRREEWEQVFQKQQKGEITTASEEQIRELSRSCSRGGGGGGSSGSSEWEIKPYSLTGTKPRHSNKHGRHYEISGDECPHLRVRNMDVGLANITRGSMMAPSYSTRADKIAVVVQGSGFVEMACPHLSSSGRSQHRREREREHGRSKREGWGREEEEEGREEEEQQKPRSYKQVRSPIQAGSVIVIPAGHPTALVADQENLAVLCFGVHAGADEKVFLAGRNSPFRQMDERDKALVFGTAAREVDRVLGAQTESVFFRGPHSRGGLSAI